jgi:hypothetical protein
MSVELGVSNSRWSHPNCPYSARSATSGLDVVLFVPLELLLIPEIGVRKMSFAEGAVDDCPRLNSSCFTDS